MKKFSEVIKKQYPPLDFQRSGISFLLEKNYGILAGVMGTGKTYQSIAAALMCGGRILVVCPAYLMWNWKLEFEKFAINPGVIHIVENTKKDLGNIYTELADIVILNYDKLQHFSHLFKDVTTVIVDEVHYLKNLKAKRTEAVHETITLYNPTNLYLLSGTPIKNNLDEFYSLIALTCYNPKGVNGRDILAEYPSFWSFRCFFSYHKIKVFGHKQIHTFDGVKNLDSFKSLLQGKYLRHGEEVLKYLPSLSIKEVVVGYEDNLELLEEFQAANRLGVGISAKTKSAIATTPFTIKYIEDLLEKLENKAIIIFSDHVKPIELIQEHFGEKTCQIITGDTNVKTRFQIVQNYQQGKIQILAATIGAASTGFNLTRGQNLVFNDLSWVPANNDQAISRIYRHGQSGSCTIHKIIGSKSSLHIMKILETKSELLKKVL